MRSFIKKYNNAIFCLLAPLIAVLISKYIAGEYFLDYVLLNNLDSTLEIADLKLYVQGLTSHIFDNPLMGAPLVADKHYWPWRNIGIGLYYIIISLFEEDIFQIYRIFYYSLFPLSALSMFLSLRFFLKLPSLISLGIGLVYAFMPFMFTHNIQHGQVLISVISIPLVLGSIFYLNFKKIADNTLINLLKTKSVLFISLIFFAAATLSMFSSFYSLILLVFLLIREAISSDRDRVKIKIVSILIMVNLLAILFNIFPHLVFRIDSHFTFRYIAKNFIHTTLYSVSIVDFFIPIKNHIFDSFKFFNQLYSQGTQIKEFFNISYLGVFGIISFLVSLGYFFKPNNTREDFSKKIGFIGVLLVFLLFMFLRGGFMTTFYLYTDFLTLGSNYRITPWIFCLCWMSGGLILHNLYKKSFKSRFLISEFTEPYLKRISMLLFVVIIGFSLLDMRGSRPYFTQKNIPIEDERLKNEKIFFVELDKIVTKEDVILQIPYVCFLETKNVYGTTYRNLWSYLLINKPIRFSNIGFQEGTACNINSQLSSMSSDIKEMIKYAVYYGYTGLMVEKIGFIDDGLSLKKRMKEVFNLDPLIDLNYLYFNINELKNNFSSLRITPIEGNALNKISIINPVNLDDSEISKMAQIFPSPCVKEDGLDIIYSLRKSGMYMSHDCEIKKLYNKSFFYFADDRIFPAPNIEIEGGLFRIEPNYIGKILSVAFPMKLKPGTYKVIIKDNNGAILSNNLFSINISEWGKSFKAPKELSFILEDSVSGTRLKPLWLNLMSLGNSNDNLSIRSITVRRIKTGGDSYIEGGN